MSKLTSTVQTTYAHTHTYSIHTHRLTHKDNIGQSLSLSRQQGRIPRHLFQYLFWRQLTSKSHLSRGTKDTSHGTSGLRRYTSRIPSILVRHQDGFNQLTIPQSVGPFNGAIRRDCFGSYLQGTAIGRVVLGCRLVRKALQVIAKFLG